MKNCSVVDCLPQLLQCWDSKPLPPCPITICRCEDPHASCLHMSSFPTALSSWPFFFFLRQSLTSLLAWELGLLLPQPPNRSSKDLKVLQQSSGLMSVNRNLHLLNKYLLSLYSWSRRCVHLSLWLLNLQTKRMWTESGPLQWVITNILSCSNCQLFFEFHQKYLLYAFGLQSAGPQRRLWDVGDVFLSCKIFQMNSIMGIC